jgi:hypothetical protein
MKVTDREPLVGLAFPSSFSVRGLWLSESSSFRDFFQLSLLPSASRAAGRFPLIFDGYDMCSDDVGGVPIVSEPCDEGDE